MEVYITQIELQVTNLNQQIIVLGEEKAALEA
jgi:hypothetical protein